MQRAREGLFWKDMRRCPFSLVSTFTDTYEKAQQIHRNTSAAGNRTVSSDSVLDGVIHQFLKIIILLLCWWYTVTFTGVLKICHS
jgi:hypothetical protein